MGLPIDYVDSRRTSFGTLAPMAASRHPTATDGPWGDYAHLMAVHDKRHGKWCGIGLNMM